MKNKWSDLDIKQKLSIISAIAAFVIGWALSIAGFFVPPLGEVHESILFILGQGLVYAASVFGIAAYFKSESTQMKNDMQRYFDHKERLMNERHKIRNGVDTPEIPIEDEDDR